MSTTPPVKPPSRPTNTEITVAFASSAFAVALGLSGLSSRLGLSVLFLLWAGLILFMIPRLIKAKRIEQALAEAQNQTSTQQIVNHDMASALLTIEGGVAALRHIYPNGATSEAHACVDGGQVESIAFAIEAEIGRIRRITQPVPTVDPDCSVESAAAPLIALHRASGVDINARFGTTANVTMSADDLARVISNVLDNCIQHAPGASITVVGRIIADRYQFLVSDNGPGITVAVGERAFDHGVSSRPGGGLGLFSARSIIEMCGGSVTIKSSSTGTTVILELPLVDDASPPSQPRQLRTQPPTRETV